MADVNLGFPESFLREPEVGDEQAEARKAFEAQRNKSAPKTPEQEMLERFLRVISRARSEVSPQIRVSRKGEFIVPQHTIELTVEQRRNLAKIAKELNYLVEQNGGVVPEDAISPDAR